MLNFFKPSPPDFTFLHTDLHSHLIPGIDDGAPDVETAVELVKILSDLGYRRLITTPHVIADLYPNTPETILSGLETLREALANAGVNMPVEAAAEYMMDDAFGEKIAAGKLLTLPGNHVLVEMGFISAPPQLYDYLFQLQTQGYKPILAHPERYLFLHRDDKQYARLHELGCVFQVNLLSLGGYYGAPVRRAAHQLVKKGWVSLLGTDLHHERHGALLKQLLGGKALAGIAINNELVRV